MADNGGAFRNGFGRNVMIRHNNINAEFAAIADFIGGGNTVVNSDYEVHPARMQLVDCTAAHAIAFFPTRRNMIAYICTD